jgi:hypothetical protein
MTDPRISDYDAYVDQTVALLGLAIAPDYRQGVVDNFRRAAEIAQLVLEFPLPSALEAAPTFEPISLEEEA